LGILFYPATLTLKYMLSHTMAVWGQVDTQGLQI